MKGPLAFALLVTALASSVPALASADDGAPPAPTRPISRGAKLRSPRVLVDVNALYQGRSLSFDDTGSAPLYGETLHWTAAYMLGGGVLFDVGAGVRAWRSLWAGVSYSVASETTTASITGTAPNLFQFRQPRAFDGESPSLTHEERAVHLSARWVVPLSRRVELAVLGGPSFFSLRRDLVETVTVQETTYPYTTVEFGSAQVTHVTASQVGVHVGADVTWRVTRTVGVGGLVRFARASTGVTGPSSHASLSIDLGGLQAGGGLRLRF